MTTTKQRLDEKIEQAARGYRIISQTSACADNGIDFGTIHGANLLAPLLLEMVEALNKTKHLGCDECQSHEFVNETSIAQDAINKFERFLK
jgi:hypothetical protein